MQYIPHHFDQGGDIDIVSLQNMANNDQYLYDEVVRRPRGVLSYAEMYGVADSESQNIKAWKDIKGNTSGESLRVSADIEDNRIIRVEAYIPHLQVRGPVIGGPVNFASAWKGIRLVRDESQLGKPIGNHYWPMPVSPDWAVAVNNAYTHNGTGFTDQAAADAVKPWSDNRDRRSVYLVQYDFPDAGRHSYGVQWKNDTLGEPPSGGALRIRNADGYNASSGENILPPCQLIITDMGSTEGLDVPPGFSDKRNRDKIASVDTTDIVHNVRRARGGKGKRHGF